MRSDLTVLLLREVQLIMFSLLYKMLFPEGALDMPLFILYLFLKSRFKVPAAPVVFLILHFRLNLISHVPLWDRVF